MGTDQKSHLNMGPDRVEPGFLAISVAAEGSPYSQEYISLLVRKNKLLGRKFGRNWYVNKAALDEYVAKQAEKVVDKAQDFAKVSPNITNWANVRQKRAIPKVRSIAMLVCLSFVLSAPIFTSISKVFDEVNRLSDQYSQLLSSNAPVPSKNAGTTTESRITNQESGNEAEPSNDINSNHDSRFPSPDSTPRVLGISNDEVIAAMRAVLSEGLPQDILSQLKGEKGDKGDVGIAVGYTLPTSPNPGSYGGFTFGSSQSFSTQDLTVTGTTTMGSLTLSKNLTVEGTTTLNGLTITNSTFTSTAQSTFTKVPTLAHVFAPSWPSGTSNASDGTIYINPASSIADGNLISAAVGGSIKFLVDAEGDVYAGNLILSGSTTTGATTIAGNLTVQDSATFGDAVTDTVSFVSVVNSNLTFTKADPSIIFNAPTAGDTDFWISLTEDGGGDDDDVLQIGDGITPGTDPFLTIDTSGNVGIGTATPGSKLALSSSLTTLAGITNTNTSNGNTLSLYTFGTAGSGSHWAGLVSANTASIEYNNALVIKTTTANPIYFGTNALPAMTILSGGNVGIGTTGPGSILDVQTANGAAMFRMTATTGTNSVYQRFTNTGGNMFVGRDNSAGTAITGVSAYAGAIWMESAHDLAFGTNNLPRMTILSGGNVGIGTTGPGARLHIISDSVSNPAAIFQSPTGGNGDFQVDVKTGTYGRAAGVRYIQGGTLGGTRYNWFAGANAVSNDTFEIIPSTATDGTTFTTPVVSIQRGGNVGIGTTATPNAKLDIRKVSETGSNPGVGAFLTLTATDAMTDGDKVALTFTTNNAGAYMASIRGQSVGIDETASLIFATNNAGTGGDRMTITGAGNVGIGTTVPQSSLHLAISGAGGPGGNPSSLQIPSNSYIVTRNASDTGGIGIIKATNAGVITVGDQSAVTNISFNTTSGDILRIQNGSVGIGTDTTNAKLYISSGTSAPLAMTRSDDGTMIVFRQSGNDKGSISVSGETISYNAFTGSHYAWTDTPIEKGMLVSFTGANRHLGDDPASEIVYGIAKTAMANDPKILGAYLSLQDPGKVPSNINPSLIMAVGNGEMWIADIGENLEVGDYLISSSIPGHAMKDDGTYSPANVIAKAAEAIDWSTVSETINGVKHKKISVLFESFENRHDNGARFNSTDVLEAGDVASFGNNYSNLVKASNQSPKIAGVVASTTVGNKANLVFSGKIKVKVSLENGPILPGDRIVLSQLAPGYGTKMLESGNSIGIALESLENSPDGKGTISAFINIAYQKIEVAQNSQGQLTASNDHDNDLNGFSLLNVKAIVSISGLWAISETGDLIVKGHIEVGKDVAGSIKLPAGASWIEVQFEKAYNYIPKVTASALSDAGSYWVGEKTSNGFKIFLKDALPSDVEFDWHALSVEPGSSAASEPPIVQPQPEDSVAEPEAQVEPVPESNPEPEAESENSEPASEPVAEEVPIQE